MKRWLLHRVVLCSAALAGVSLPLVGTAEEPIQWEPVARQLQAATATVRVCTRDCAKPEAVDKEASDKPKKGEAEELRPQVSVCSGFFVDDKLLVTAIHAGTDSSIRLTYHDGTQANGTLKVIDEYSGLVLLESDEPAPGKLEVCQKAACAGNWAMTAAAWGTEKPLVSLGIVSCADRTVAGVNYPPLLQCDLRVSETSGGAAVVNRDCRLVGVMVAADASDIRRGWAYAVPAVHVSRLLRAQVENGENVVVLKRRRPFVGVDLDSDEHGIFVRRVHAKSPAEKAGIAVGDRIVATEGVKIRSVYQAVLPTLRKQPGDLFLFRIKRDGKERDVPLVLGGGMELSTAPLDLLGGIVQPKISIQSDKRGSYSFGSGRGAVKDLAAHDAPVAGGEKASERQLLEKANERLHATIEALQKRIESLERENAELKKK
jgi:serine protease Do